MYMLFPRYTRKLALFVCTSFGHMRMYRLQQVEGLVAKRMARYLSPAAHVSGHIFLSALHTSYLRNSRR
jgi:hypothetical protein